LSPCRELHNGNAGEVVVCVGPAVYIMVADSVGAEPVGAEPACAAVGGFNGVVSVAAADAAVAVGATDGLG
jgi:hypothetical protein